jgi:enoyl-CoA hydratase/carnithine racemase
MGTIGYETDERIATITIQGDSDLNGFGIEMLDELIDRLLEFQDDPDLSVAIVTGHGTRAFSVGFDFNKLMDHPDLFKPESSRNWVWFPRSGLRKTFTRLMLLEVDKPVVAAVNGHCLAGGLIFMVQISDVRVAGRGATFGLAETKLGLVGGAVTGQLDRFLPEAIAMEMVLTGEPIGAEDAYRWGFVNRLVEPDEVMPTARAMAKKMAALPVRVLKAEKEGARRGRGLSRADTLRIAQYQYSLIAQEPTGLRDLDDFKRLRGQHS